MLKHVLLAGAFAIAAPAFAQDTPAQETAPAPQQTTPPADTATAPETAAPGATAPTTSEPADTAAPAEPTTSSEATDTTAKPSTSDAAEPATEPKQAAATPSTTAQPANATQIAAIVDQGFPTYNKSGGGELKPDEFGAWMVALRSATEPAFTGQSAADKDWIGKAMAMADTDKSGGVSSAELKGFLAPQAAS